jgi:hypothetical protein
MKKFIALFVLILPIFILGSEDSFIYQLLGANHTIYSFLAFMLWGVFGLLFSWILDISSSGISPSQFKLRKWWSENSWRVITSVMILLLAVVFADQLVGVKSSTWGMFIAGLAADKIIETLNQRRRKINEQMDMYHE